MKYLVTYCVFGREAGANPLYHSGMILSKTDDTGKQLKVVDTWGFYGVPKTGDRTGYLSRFKIWLGLDVDWDNHGMLQHEPLRFLELGGGLQGVSFELTEEKFDLLESNCLKMVADQKSAVNEVVEPQGIKGKALDKVKVYEHEEFAHLIYEIEKIKAKQKGVEPRLKPFELRLTFGLWGPALNTSKTCKSQILALLATVLTQEQIDRLTEGGKHPTIPRFSGVMEDIYLYSTGPLRQHKKSDGSIVHYRDWKDADVELFWALPPQEIETLSEDTTNRFKMDDEHCSDAKSVVGKLERLYWIFQNAVVPEHLKNYKELLIKDIVASYKSFFSIESKPSSRVGGWLGYFSTLLSAPRDEEEKILLAKLNKAKMLFNTLYMAIVDNWKIDSSRPIDLPEFQIQDEEDDAYYNPVEAIAAYLPITSKQKLCEIIGRNYVEDESLEDEETRAESISMTSG